MNTGTATVSENGSAKAQLQLMTDENGGRRVQLYGRNGVMLCDSAFEGNDDQGFAIGQALYIGYCAGWDNAKYHFSLSIMKALDTVGKSEIV